MNLAAITGAIRLRRSSASSVPATPVVHDSITAPDGIPLDDFQLKQDRKLQAIFNKINEGDGSPIDRVDSTTTALVQCYRRRKEL